MKNQVSTGALLKGLEAVQKINKTIGKLNHDKISVSVNNNTMTLNSINFIHQVLFTLPVINGENISTGIIGLEKLIKAIKKFDKTTTIEVDENNVILSDGKKKLVLPAGEVDEVTHSIENNPFTVDGVILNEAYGKVKKSIAKEDTRPVLTGVHFKDNYIETVDGYRISQVKITESEFSNNFVIPVLPLEIILPLAKKDKFEVVAANNDKSYTLSAKNSEYKISITGHLIDGDFINTEQILSNDYEYLLSFSENKEIINELSFIKDMVGISETGRPLPIKLLLNNDNLIIADGGENTSSMVTYNKLDGKLKDTFKIAFNPNYMLDAIKNISGEFTMQFISHLTPCIIKNDKERYLVLPVRLA